MDKKYICYCGLYCENCAVKVKIEPAAKLLYNEMKKAGFDDVIKFVPNGEAFWAFLKYMAIDEMCISCKERGGDPGCKVRICAKEKGVEMCALCDSYPCEIFEKSFFPAYPFMKQDNAFLIEKGMEEWAKLQDNRKEIGFTYQDN